MTKVCLYFQVHQPRLIRKYQAFDIGQDVSYFADYIDGINVSNPEVIKTVAEKCYEPANELILNLLKDYPELQVTYSITGNALEQFEQHAPQVIESFQRLATTGQVEMLAETYYHSLASLYDETEFKTQVELHTATIQEYFGLKPTILRNSELIYSNGIARLAKEMGFSGVIGEGAAQVLEWRSPNYLYAAPNNMPLLLKNWRLSEDIALNFSSTDWEHHPLDADTYANWINNLSGEADVVNLFMDYETFGVNHSQQSGIFDLLAALPKTIFSHSNLSFATPSQAIESLEKKANLDVENHIAWNNHNQSLEPWLSNDMQKEALDKLYSIKERVLATGNPKLISDWRHLQTSNHFYYMSTSPLGEHAELDGYLNPFESPYVAFLSFMNIVQDLDLQIEANSQMANTQVNNAEVNLQRYQ